MSNSHRRWDSTGFTDNPMTLVPRRSNSPLSLATAPSSVVQTGVKSAGWLNSTPQEPSSHSWNRIGPPRGLRVEIRGGVAQL